MPQSDVPGEHTSPTQPFPTKPPPFARQTFTERDINPYLPEAEQEILRQKLRTSRNDGLFTPPSFEGSIGMPGHNGGANWAGSAVDPINGELYIVSKNLPVMLRMELRRRGAVGAHVNGPVVTPEKPPQRSPPRRPRPRKARCATSRRTTSCAARRTAWAPMGPPWSHITAYDLNTGEIKWRIPHGGTAGIGADVGAHFPRGAPLVTAGGLRVRRDRARPPAARLRSRHRQGAVVVHAAGRVGRHSGDLRARRPAVPRGAGGGRRGVVRAALDPAPERRRSNAPTSCSRCR